MAGGRRELNRLGDLAALEAACADVGARRLPVEHDADALQVRVEAALRGDHRVAPVVTEARLLPADGANLGHRPRSVAEGPLPSRRADISETQRSGVRTPAVARTDRRSERVRRRRTLAPWPSGLSAPACAAASASSSPSRFAARTTATALVAGSTR